MIDLAELFPKPMGEPLKIKDTGFQGEWIGISSDRLNSNTSKDYHKGRKRRFFKNDTAYSITKDGAFGCRRQDVFVFDRVMRNPLIRELTRIGSYPDDFKLSGTFEKQWERIGNSVPPLMMYAIAAQIRHKLWQGEKPQTMVKNIDYPAHLEMMWQKHLAPRADNAPTVISTFAGGGGSSLGYSMAGYKELLAVEWDNNAVETFKLNFPEVPVYHGDIAKLSVDECLSLAGIKPGELDLFDGSPPCQGFSTAGKRIMNDPRNQLFKEYIRLLRGLKPKVFVMENVSGMVKGKMKLVFAEILRELKASGYRVSARLLNAMYFHVPQNRQRIIFIGVREDLGVEPSHPKAEGKPITVGDAVANMTAFSVPAPALKGQVKENSHKLMQGQRYGNSRDFFRLNKKNVCSTIPKAPSQFNDYPKWIYPTENRGIHLDELKRLASYPASYDFIDWQSGWCRIGNSVPPLMAEAIGRHIRYNILQAQHVNY